MPWPAVRESFWSGRISPKSRPPLVADVAEELDCCRDRESEFSVRLELRMRLANDFSDAPDVRGRVAVDVCLDRKFADSALFVEGAPAVR